MDNKDVILGEMEIQHSDPAWAEKADYVIGAIIEDRVWTKRYHAEQLAARRIAPGRYEICCIPFALYDICLGDIVKVDKEYNVVNAELESDHVGFRVATKSLSQQKNLLEYLDSHKIAFSYEVFSGRLMSLDAEDAISGKQLADALDASEAEGIIMQYETIRT